MGSLKSTLNVYRARFTISLKIYFRYPLRVIVTLFDPIIWLTPFYFMGKSFSINGKMVGFEKYTGNSDFIGFIVIGYMILTYINTVFWTMGFSLKEEMEQGVLESNWCTPSKRIDLLIGNSLFYFLAATIEIIITGIICHLVFGFTINNNILKAIMFLIPGIISMLGFGMIIAGLVLIAKRANPIIDITSSLLSGICGGYFPIRIMSKGFLFVALMIPLTYIYDGMRAILINQEPILSLKYEAIIMIISMFVFMILGNIIFMKIDKKCRTLGIIGTH